MIRSYRYYWASIIRQPLSWVLTILLDILVLLLYLLSGLGKVTTFSGTTSFFSTISLVSLIILPALSIRAQTPSVSYEETFPVSLPSRIIGEVFALGTLYLISLCLTVPMLFIPAGFITLEAAPCITSYLVLVLYGFSIISFCTWISRLFLSTVFSYLVTIALLIAGNTIHLLPIDAPWIKSVSFIWHFDSASKGILATKDLLFFIAVTSFCITASVECARFRKNTRNLQPAVYLVLEAVLLVLVIANGAVFNFRLDTTRDKRFSLSDESKAVIASVHEPLRITWYVSKSVLNQYPQTEDMKNLLLQYADQSNYLSVAVVSDSDRLAAANLGQLGITPQTLSTSNSEESRTLQVYSAMVLEMGESVGVIPFVLSNTSLEYDLTFRIRSLVSGEVPVVAVLNGTGLDLDSYYRYLFPWINSSGMLPVALEPSQLSLLDSAQRAVLLVIGSQQFTTADVQAVDQWILSGKPAFFAVNPITVDIAGTWQAESMGTDSLLNLLDYYGVQIGNQLVYDRNCFTLTMYSSANQQSAEFIPYPYWPVSETSWGQSVQLYWPVSLTLYETEVCKPLVVATSGTGAGLVSSPFVTNPFALEQVESVPSDSAVVAAVLQGKLFSYYEGAYSPDTRIMVMGDQYFVSNMVETTGSGQNFSFLISSLLYLTGDEDLLSIKSRWE